MTRALRLLLILLLCVAGYFAGSHISRLGATKLLYVPADALDLGDIELTSDFKCTLPVTNFSSRQADVVSIRRSCDCTSLTPSTFTLAPGDTEYVSLAINLSSQFDLHRSSWPFAATLEPIIKESAGSSVVWSLRARIHNTLGLPAPVLDFGDDIISGEPQPSQTISLRPRTDMALLEADCDPPFAKAVVRHIDRNQFDLEVILDKVLPIGPLDCSILLTATRADGHRLRQIAIPVRGVVGNNLIVSPSVVLLGSRLSGEQVSLTTKTGTPFVLEDFWIEGAEHLVISHESTLPEQVLLRITCHSGFTESEAGHLCLQIRVSEYTFVENVPVVVQAMGPHRTQ